MRKKNSVKQSDSIHRASEYRAASSVAIAGVMDGLISDLETSHADFPKKVRRYVSRKSATFTTAPKGIDTVDGEQQRLHWLIDGLLQLMDEATGKGHTTDATRFAFEAGLLWSMSNHAQARKTQANIVGQLAERRRLAVQSRNTKADLIAERIRREVDAVLRGSPVKMTSTSARKALAGKSHFTDGTPMVCLRTINEAFARKSKSKNR